MVVGVLLFLAIMAAILPIPVLDDLTPNQRRNKINEE